MEIRTIKDGLAGKARSKIRDMLGRAERNFGANNLEKESNLEPGEEKKDAKMKEEDTWEDTVETQGKEVLGRVKGSLSVASGMDLDM